MQGGDAAGSGAAGGGSAAPAPPLGSLAAMAARIDNTYLRELREDPQAAAHAPNTRAREVHSGHYVRVAPLAMAEPYLVAFSSELAATLGLEPSECQGAPFLRVFSGDLRGAPEGFAGQGWATPYANSIYGEPILNPAPRVGPNGYGYGDGRAISIAQVVLPAGQPAGGAASLELQLKGAGPTPFRRDGEGFAVLRSSVREFLASEAMHALGVPTTRALSLVASAAPEDAVVRQWVSDAGRQVVGYNIRAITTRVARSLLRVGQFELYGRRAARGEATGLEELALLARHALAREYPHLLPPGSSDGSGPMPAATLQPALLAMLREASTRLATLAAHWLRVGYVQSNFNADNCLVGGVTMDYGPFGFMEPYNPEWGMWVGTGAHFAFGNQPVAAGVNFGQLQKSLLPLLDEEGRREAERIVKEYPSVSARVVGAMWASKLGLSAGGGGATAAELARRVLELMQSHPTDYTIAWRQLARALPGDPAAAAEGAAPSAVAAETKEALLARCMAALQPAFYAAPIPAKVEADWRVCA
jgi:uncharacterized protein YdiU (UPF0061 family)